MVRAQHSRALLPIFLLFVPGPLQDSRPTRPVDVFKDLEGHWAGTFVGYDTTGKELYRIRVQQWYRTLDATTQEVRLEDTMADGTVVTGKGQNVATRTADGRLRLSCRVKKSNGDRVEHEGRLVRGPGGDRQIVWFTKSKRRTETFREWVVGNKADRTYHIHGLGNYDGQLMMMAGRYRIQD